MAPISSEGLTPPRGRGILLGMDHGTFREWVLFFVVGIFGPAAVCGLLLAGLVALINTIY